MKACEQPKELGLKNLPNCNAFVTNLSNKSTHWMDVFQISHVHENEPDKISHVWRSRALEDFQYVPLVFLERS